MILATKKLRLLEVYPPFYIGVSGHQNLGGEEVQRFVVQEFQKVVRSHQNEGKHVILYTVLAKGADRLFVRSALELGIPVEVVIPCAEYANIFAEGPDKDDYYSLLAACPIHHQLPIQSCSDDAYLAAGQWIIERCHLLVVAWNGYPPLGRSGTGDAVSYARFIGCPYLHLHTRQLTATLYEGTSSPEKRQHRVAPKQADVTKRQPVYQGSLLTVEQLRVQMPGEKEVVRNVVTWPESVLVLPVGENNIVLLIEEYDFGAGVWQLTLPGGKVESGYVERKEEQVQKELRQEIGYRANRIEKLLSMYSHPGYVSHTVHTFVASHME